MGMAIRRAGHLLAGIAVSATLAAATLPAQAQEFGLPDSNILVIDTNRLFAETSFGKRVERDIEAQSTALAAENRRIESELAGEEKSLTEERPDMAPDAFREKADAFDAKVTRIRREQEAKAVALAGASDAAQRRFLAVARPVLEELMIESGAALLLDRRSVLLSSGAVDVTDEAVRRIDLAIGDGSQFLTEPQDQAPPDDSQQE